ncbi:GTP-binding protein [Staphylococcus sp. NRL 16/872]|uniref:CobW family GTP-binding protein n=1 Tax=Staphylococcus sp. NRL 16/872 TaxID=2930131 RepID=UPI001FB2693B|nr:MULTISPECIES: GTP-binding protein [unclassified Staphylococcus]MCJ1656955.1 GTP-binding protein [Staphylococcus sp. NRL 21/187]MCJ1662702.1 GTP-binding protein [Staphylococcus sp. NRL 18/288]WEN69026.1 GTP-binding protein [Staphylococcus sp. NRL 16/872]
MINNKNEKISITIISGFLGSGKTTFLKYYIDQLLKKDEKVTIIMNEFGQFDVDSLLVGEDVSVKSLINGCVCCDLNNDLVNQLNLLVRQKEMQHIVIEATGIAHPLEIFTACQDPSIIRDVQTPQIIGLVDAQRFSKKDNYTDSTISLMEEQIAYSDVIILNKTDLVEEETLKNSKEELSRLNSEALLISTTYSQVNDEELKGHMQPSSKSHHHTHHYHIQSMQYTFTSAIDRQLFYRFILRLPDNVLRLKGFVKFRDLPEATYEFQYSMGLPDYGVIDKNVPLTIVIIGEGLDINRLRNQLEMIQFT